MRPANIAATALAVALLLSVPAPSRAGEPTPANPIQLRDRIVRDVTSGLAHKPVTNHPTPPAAVSRPTNLHPRPAQPAEVAPDAAHAADAPADTSAEGLWNELLAGNQRFVAEHPRVRPLAHERAELENGQHPHTIILGCADSRVSPEIVFDQSLGDLFVVRTAGNIVDPITLGSIEYAAEHLHARLLIVLGHGNCGAVKAAASGDEMPSTYLQAIVDRIRPTVQRLSPCFEGDELIERSVIANARQSAQDVLANSTLLREAVAKGHLKVVSAFYDLHTGVVTPVTVSGATAQASTPVH
jgi:carbonic anhydrase